jgi:hypothetical protein
MMCRPDHSFTVQKADTNSLQEETPREHLLRVVFRFDFFTFSFTITVKVISKTGWIVLLLITQSFLSESGRMFVA